MGTSFSVRDVSPADGASLGGRPPLRESRRSLGTGSINNYTQHLASHVFVFCFPLAMLFAHASEFCIDMTYSESS